MLKPEDNVRITRVGPGTECGELMRRYWQPALLSRELSEPDGPPVRVRLLGEDLIAFRDTSGVVGLVGAYCPHRLAPLFFGRNEECGLRCVYHGWKFDREGNCVDMPSEPAGTRLQEKVKLKAYPTCERGGIVWTYMGPADKLPEPPDYEFLRAPETHRFVSKTFQECNYLQAMEGGFDTAHSSYVHNNDMADTGQLRTIDRRPRIEVESTDYGYRYASTRKLPDNREYVRIYHYMMPHVQVRAMFRSGSGEKAKVPKQDGHIWVPIDDISCYVYNWTCGRDKQTPLSAEFIEELETFTGRGSNDFIAGSFKLKRNKSNDYLIDRELQRTTTYTGITGLNTQDMALQEGMGPIVDRSKEFLGTSDLAIVKLRRTILDAIATVREGGDPPGVDAASYRNTRAYDDVIAAGSDWREEYAENLKAYW